jgi:cytochrome P450
VSRSAPRPFRPTDIGVAGPTSWDMLRGFTSVRADPLGFLLAVQARYGDLVAFPVPGPPVLLVNDPADVRQVLASGARHWGKQTVQYSSLARVTGPGLLASAEPSWIEHRRVAGPAFHHRRLEGVADQVRAAAREAVGDWRSLPPEGAVVDVAELALRVALDIVGRALFSADLSDRTQRLLQATSHAAQLIVALGRSIVPVPPWVPTRVNLRLRAAGRELDALCRELIERRRRESTGSSGDDLLGLLMDGGLTDGEIRDELVTMVVAGHETVAAALAWTLMLLAEDQPAQQRLRAEVRGLEGPVPMVGTGDRLPWTRAVVDESLRLFPPAWVVSRRSSRPDVLSGSAVPAGTMVIISPWLLHRRASSWSQPLDFCPQRFLGGTATTARSDYIPFGLGPRLCIGRDFALGEMVVVLSELLAEHRVSLPPGWSRPAPQTLVAVHPRGGMPLHVSACEWREFRGGRSG